MYEGIINDPLRTNSGANRILNSVKTYGNIVCFYDLQKATDDAIAFSGDKNDRGIVLLKSFNDYWNSYENKNGKYHSGYIDLLENWKSTIPCECFENKPMIRKHWSEERI